MTFGRDLTVKIRFIIDEFTPPILRDRYWFMFLPIKLACKEYAKVFMNFKQSVIKMNDKQFSQVYEDIESVSMVRDTDLNKECFEKIPLNIKGDTVLEVGSGKGLLAIEISKTHKVTASDIVVNKDFIKQHPNIPMVQAKAEELPFKDKSFDTVVCTHTLEHVLDLQKAISELRRVARKRIIIVVPKQRPYRYTFDLHLHFFPYPESLEAAMGYHPFATCEVIGGDLLYIEDKK